MSDPNGEPVFPEEERLTDKDLMEMMDNPILFSDDDDEDFSLEEATMLLKSLDKAVRAPPTGAEHLIANELAIAVVSPSLDKIRHICEAWMILDGAEVKTLGMEEAYPIIKRTYALVHCFTRPREDFDYDDYANPREMVRLGLPFTEDEALEYLHPWATRLPFESYPNYGRLSTRQLDDLMRRYSRLFKDALFVFDETGELDPRITEALVDFKARYLYWNMRDGLTHETYNGFVTAFIAEHIPMAMQWFKKIMSKVSPSSFKEAVASIGLKIPS
ncbi:MAG: hypothetical protein ACTSPB_09085 [Candidatus Thorarchaeota archaeon]